ncbi:ATP-grasp domain-containing protein [Chryseobacterium sp. MYb264]|uniref:ATP-grasp domain-containing protein n=1 Tax=Chryseobacterium sp. MYb264 TaxID=2745153 RepID=UPI002E155698|nr:ATP-grasp domain-containing protein [Chryseobacterium sp. MYb264]
MQKVAIIYQSRTPPPINGIIKPMKPGGYSDSGADIAYSLKKQNIEVITPTINPQIDHDLDWVFPDTKEGIQLATAKGANIIWLNTVLYKNHPIEEFIHLGISVVGQIPENVDLYDDKWITNELLKSNGLPIPKSVMMDQKNKNDFDLNFSFPVVAKPIRGRGSQGVSLVQNEYELRDVLNEMFHSNTYGESLYVEEFLSGQEVTVTIMPPGKYFINKENIIKNNYWSLPAVKRFNHENGIAPYNGKVAITNNSEVLQDSELQSLTIQQLNTACEKAARLVESKAPIRIDCRANFVGKYFLFDLNMKPNMTGASRPHRTDQDSLTALAARKIGWNFDDLILNMLNNSWCLNND